MHMEEVRTDFLFNKWGEGEGERVYYIKGRV